ncbi:ABC transporter permease [Ruania halotolerans]|uniref:ABC transporter permease n=1 Tax=Ruania halotolerans TaxID=2897773 RepID=UPI001E2DA05F|nr:ABC transporter permease subunit [Ruania halotolerans]UFU06198.1 ABC transporter permease subunit [Ruania halotolerans]
MTSPTTTAPPTPRAPAPGSASRRPTKKHQYPLGLRLKRSWRLYVLLLPPFVYGILFMWAPLYGLQMAFKDFSVALGISGSPWAGLKYLDQFVNSFQFGTVIKNSLILNFYELLALFPLPIVLALLLNVVRNMKFKRTVQLITYAPYFISTVVVVGIIIMLFSPSGGIVNQVIVGMGGQPTDFLSSDFFRHTYVWSGAWQTLGYSAIIYLAALAGIDPQLHEAAKVDGASIVRRIWHIDLPGILPVMVTLLILNMGSMLSVGFEKVLLMQTPLNLDVSEVIDTYSYNVAFASSIPQYSYAAAIGLFKSVIAVIMLVMANWLARRVAKTSLF